MEVGFIAGRRICISIWAIDFFEDGACLFMHILLRTTLPINDAPAKSVWKTKLKLYRGSVPWIDPRNFVDQIHVDGFLSFRHK